MRCGKARRWISVRLDGELDAARTEALEAHLGSCHRCRAFATDLGQLGETLNTVSAKEPRWGFAERVTARIADVKPNHHEMPLPRILRPLPVGVGAAAFCAGMLLVILANGQAEALDSQRSDAVAVLADSYLGISAEPALEDELISLLPQTED
ncbi:MAG: zf-HC2 domain-containing protein [Planctomycetota bacterium]|jgi:anti-sigma factor RsiW